MIEYCGQSGANMRTSLKRVLSISLLVCALFVAPQLTFGQTSATPSACNQATADPVTDVSLPGHPFMALATPDGCWIFVSMQQGRPALQAGVAVVQRMRGTVTLARVISLENSAVGMVLSHDGKMLIVTNGDYVDFLDVARLKSGEGDPKLGRIYGGPDVAETNVNVTPDDRFLFVSDHAIPKETATVYRLDKAREASFKGDFKVGSIHVGREVLAILFAQDPRYLYIVTEQAGSDTTWSAACPQNPPVKKAVEGTLNVIDVKRAETDPTNSIVARIKAGCVATRMALSPRGDRLYVTARADNALVVLDTTKFLKDPEHAKVATVPVGVSPMGVSLMDNGKKLVVTNVGTTEEPQSLTVIDAAKVTSGSGAVLGTIPVGSGPRDASLTKDGRTLFVPNFNSRTLRLIDLARLHPVK
jgi:DNA-binding beta-propeller fold protein YncE